MVFRVSDHNGTSTEGVDSPLQPVYLRALHIADRRQGLDR